MVLFIHMKLIQIALEQRIRVKSFTLFQIKTVCKTLKVNMNTSEFRISNTSIKKEMVIQG